MKFKRIFCYAIAISFYIIKHDINFIKIYTDKVINFFN